jgi:hypothetical protein
MLLRSLPALLVVSTVFAAPDFRGGVYPVLTKANCRACHTESGVASATRLHFPETDADVDAFGQSLRGLVDPANPVASPLYTKPTGRVKHTGGKLIQPGSPQERALLEWVRHLATTTPPAKQNEKTQSRTAPSMRRLTHSQYNHTVRDLLGDQTAPASQFPQEDFVNGFKNQADAQSIPALLTEAYSAAAEKLARNAFRDRTSLRLVPCKPAQAGCGAKFIREFGLRAFRRPLTTDEVQRYQALLKNDKDFYNGAQLVVEAMLQSPNFLFRAEKSPAQPTAYEIASRLSYFLWDSMPDQRLFEDAAAGKLSTREGVEAAARRMLDDARAREALDEFTSQWLRFDRVVNTVKERRQFPMFTPELAWAMTEETRRLIADAVWEQRDFMTVFSGSHTFLNSDLAGLYKVPAPQGEFERVALPDGERAGLLGHASFLSLTSKPGDTSPTARGLFVREQFLCQHVPDPPPGTNSNLPPISESKPQTNRDRLGVHVSNQACANCHKLIDPIGFGLERFDAVGGYREKLKLRFPETKERKKAVTIELDLDTSGEVSGIQDSQFRSPKELGSVLAASRQCQECVVKQVFRFANGRPENAADRPVIQTAFTRFRDSGFRFTELLTATAVSLCGF